MKNLKSISIISLGMFLLTTTPVQSQTATNQNNKSKKVTKNIVQRTYKLKGFKQSCCYNMVEFTLQELKGYVKSKPNMTKQEITVWFNTDLNTEEEIIAAINKTGYTVTEE